MRAHCENPPPAIAHWKKGQAIFYTLVEPELDVAAARSFMRSYAGTLARTEWKVVVDPS